MKKYKQYEVRYKRFLFQVIVAPPVEDLWCFDRHPAESTIDVDGGVKGMSELADIFKIAINSSKKIIYFPIKRKASDTLNLVLSGRYVDGFKPSVWYKIKPFLDNDHRIHNYRLKWNRKKAMDYINYEMSYYHTGLYKKDMAEFTQKVLGDTVFMHFSRRDLYEYWESIEEGCKEIRQNADRKTVGWGLGFVLNEEFTKMMAEEEKNASRNG